MGFSKGSGFDCRLSHSAYIYLVINWLHHASWFAKIGWYSFGDMAEWTKAVVNLPYKRALVRIQLSSRNKTDYMKEFSVFLIGQIGICFLSSIVCAILLACGIVNSWYAIIAWFVLPIIIEIAAVVSVAVSYLFGLIVVRVLEKLLKKKSSLT